MMRTRLDALRRQPQVDEVPSLNADGDMGCEDPIVEFLEARIAEKEDDVRRNYVNRASTFAATEGEIGPIGQLILADCAMKRTILANWRAAAAANGFTRLVDAVDPVALSCRSMLRILAAGYESHPDFREEWFDRA